MQPLISMIRTAQANMTPVRQRTQYSCVPTSLAMCLNALGHNCSEDEVNAVMGARPMKGATWEQVLATAQHYGCRATLTMPSTVWQLKEWTDRGIPVMIAWNPEGREWSHASAVFHVDEDGNVHVADPNIPDPDEVVRVVSKGDFYKKWYEKWPNYLVRRPACAIEREITQEGRQVMASMGEREMVASELARQWGPTLSRTARRDMKLLTDHQKKWEATKAEFDKELVKGLESFKEVEADAKVGNVMVNFGPVFGVRYLSLSFSTGGSTVPAEKFPPFFYLSYFPSFGGVKDWPFLPIKDIERDMRSVVQKILGKRFSAFGKAKPYAGGSAAPGRGVIVEIPEELLENAWKNLPSAGKPLGKAIADLLRSYQKRYQAAKESTIADLEEELKDLQEDVEYHQKILDAGGEDEKDLSWNKSLLNSLEIDILRLEEQLGGLRKMAKKKKDSHPWRDPNSAARAKGEGSRGGPHKNRERDLEKGRSRKPKHKNKQDWQQHLSSNWD